MRSTRRDFLKTLGVSAAAIAASRWFEPGVFAEEAQRLIQTPRMTEGPFYPDKLTLDVDNDLLVINNSLTPAVGHITHLSGRVLGSDGAPVKNAVIEIWQVDNHGSYLHSRGVNHRSGQRDTNFQGYGQFVTGSTGEYRFRTIKPVAYPGRTPHIHVRVSYKNKEVLTTQFYIKGEKQNDRDGVLGSVRNAKARETVISEYTPVTDSTLGELAASYQIVLGLTPTL